MLDVSTKGQEFEYYSGIWVDLAQGDKNILRCWDILTSLLYILASPVYYFTCHYDNQLCGFQHTSCRCNLTIPHTLFVRLSTPGLGFTSEHYYKTVTDAYISTI